MARARSAVCALGALCATHAWAQDAGDAVLPALSPITVIGTPATLEPGSAYTLLLGRVLSTPGADATNLLRLLPGVQVDRSARSGSVASLYLRGGDPNWTPIFIDGVRVNDPTNSRGGGVDLALLDPGMIERVDIVRGPASALVGSDAIAGVINIVTRAPRDARDAEWAAEAGSRGYGTARGSVDVPLGPAAAAKVHASHLDGGDVVAGGRSRADTARVALRMSPRSGTLRVTASALREDGHSFPEDSGGPLYASLPALARHRTDQQTAALSYVVESDRHWSLRVLASGLWQRQDEASPAIPPGVRDPAGLPATRTSSQLNRQTLRVVAEAPATTWLRIAVGGQYERESGSSVGLLLLDDFSLPTDFALRRVTRALFGEARIEVGPLTVTAGTRVDHTDGVSSTTTPRVAAVIDIARDWDLRASYGKGFKLPSFFALSHPIVGNPALSAEESRGFDVGLTRRMPDAGGEVSFTVYRLQVDHAIDFDPGPPPRLVNRDRFTSDGAEVSWQARVLPSVHTSGQIGYAFARTDAGTPLRNRPRVEAAAAVMQTVMSGLDAGLSFAYVGRTVDSSIPTGQRVLGSYWRADVNATYRLNASTRLIAGVENVADRRYEEMVGFPGPRRTLRLGVDVVL